MNKASGGDEIPVELFKILKDDAVKMLHSVCQQIWKTQQWPQDWKRSVFIPIPKKGNAKEYSYYCTIALISHASKVMLKILQARLQQYMNRELADVQAGFRKGPSANCTHLLSSLWRWATGHLTVPAVSLAHCWHKHSGSICSAPTLTSGGFYTDSALSSFSQVTP